MNIPEEMDEAAETVPSKEVGPEILNVCTDEKMSGPVQIDALVDKISPGSSQPIELPSASAPVKLRLPFVSTTTLPADSKML